MAVFIPIDRGSVRINPRAGQTVHYLPGRPGRGVDADGQPTLRYNVQTIYSLTPEPPFHFKYVPTPVPGCDCKSPPLHIELELDEYWDGEGDFLIQTCPRCHCAVDELEFEVLPFEVMQELADVQSKVQT
jgi:hypothetical protein